MLGWSKERIRSYRCECGQTIRLRQIRFCLACRLDRLRVVVLIAVGGAGIFAGALAYQQICEPRNIAEASARAKIDASRLTAEERRLERYRGAIDAASGRVIVLPFEQVSSWRVRERATGEEWILGEEPLEPPDGSVPAAP
ncbi:MAG: hypothetical protein AAGB51_11160 [Planctomycetota bacterium]